MDDVAYSVTALCDHFRMLCANEEAETLEALAGKAEAERQIRDMEQQIVAANKAKEASEAKMSGRRTGSKILTR